MIMQIKLVVVVEFSQLSEKKLFAKRREFRQLGRIIWPISKQCLFVDQIKGPIANVQRKPPINGDLEA